MPDSPNFNLVTIFAILLRRWKFVATLMLLAGLLSAVIYLIKPKSYKSTSQFFVASPYFTDRNNLFRGGANTAYFADDGDIDKVVGISETEDFKRSVIEKAGLARFYKMKWLTEKNMPVLIRLFSSGFDLERSEFGYMDLTYIAEDADTAALVANLATEELEKMFSSFHTGMRKNAFATLGLKLTETDSSIASMTNILAGLREQYGFYDIVSPNRNSIITTNYKNSTPGFGMALEKIQNIESIKAQLVYDRARYMTAYNEFGTSNKADEMPLFTVISKARPAVKPSGAGLVGTIVAAMLLTAFLSVLWVLLSGFFVGLYRKQQAAAL